MDRKKVIFIAIAINAGLIVLLFLTSLYREEEVPLRKELALQVPTNPSAFVIKEQELPKSMAFEPPAQPAPPEIVHQLPPLQQELTPILAKAEQGLEVTVKKGDTLDKIAKAHHVAIDEILRLNQLPSTLLRVGQVLKLPTAKAKAEPAPVQPDYYVVKVGDTPWTIARKYNMKPEELLKMNQLNSEKARKLKPGDRLRVK